MAMNVMSVLSVKQLQLSNFHPVKRTLVLGTVAPELSASPQTSVLHPWVAHRRKVQTVPVQVMPADEAVQLAHVSRKFTRGLKYGASRP